MKNPLRRLTTLILATCLPFAPAALAVDPPPGGGYLNLNTALGEDALFSLTNGGGNTAAGWHALYSDTSGTANTGTGAGALEQNTIGCDNTAVGNGALDSNTTGDSNVAVGVQTLFMSKTGDGNVAVGWLAASNINGNDNVAIGDRAMANTSEGSFNTAVGYSALSYVTGTHNIALGPIAGVRLRAGSHNIDIGNAGRPDDYKTIRIGNNVHRRAFVAGISGVTVAGGVSVIIDSHVQLGTITSSARYKEAIEPMAKASEALLSLKPVSFRYKKALDPKGIPQFGLVAEEVAEVDPDLVARDDSGRPYTVRYEAVNAMLLNEFLKEHRKVAEQGAKVGQLEATVAKLQSALKKQEAQLRKVNERPGTISSAPRLVENR